MKRKTFSGSVAVLLGALALATVLLGGCENKIIFQPEKYPQGLWDISNIPLPIEDVWFQAADGVKLHGWYVPREGAVATLLFFHGNAGNISHRLNNIFYLHHLKLNVFIFDYRGFGRSEGDPDEEGVQLDSQSAYDTVRGMPGVSPDTLFIFGRSLGGSFAAYTASRNPAAGLILESTFTNADDMADKMFSILPVGWFLSARLDTRGYVAQLKTPKLFMHGTMDQVIPFTLGHELYKSAAEPKEFYSITGAGHNNTVRRGGRPYFDKIMEFINRNSAGQGPELISPPSEERPQGDGLR